jgi:hypothetical protein
MTLRFFTSQTNYLKLTDLGVKQLIGRIQDRPSNTWNVSRLLDGPLKEKLTTDLNNLRKNLTFEGSSTDHHIFPGNKIAAMVKKALENENGVNTINTYMNSRKGVFNLLNSQVHPPKGQNVNE